MKELLSLVLLLAFAAKIEGQQRFQMGLHVSNKMTWFNNDERLVTTDGIRYGGGVQFVFDYNITENYVFNTGIGLMSVGGKIQYVDSLPYFSTSEGDVSIPPQSIITNKIEAFAFPLTLKLRTNDIGNIRLYGRFGLQLHVRSKVKGDINIMNEEEVNFLEGENITKEISLFTATSPLMAGIEYDLWENTRLIIELGYDHGWTNVSRQIKNPDGSMSDKRRNVTLGYLSLNAGILF